MAQLRATLIDANVVQMGDGDNDVVTVAAAASDGVIGARPAVSSHRVRQLEFDCK